MATSNNGSTGSDNGSIYDHRWGFKDSRFEVMPNGSVTFTGSRYNISGTEMPDLIPFAEEILGVKFDLSKTKPEMTPKPVAAPVINRPFLEDIAARFPATQFTDNPRQRLIHSHGQTTADEVYKVLYDELDRVADLVFFIESTEDAEALIELAEAHDVCLVPYGGGTSVSSALQLPTNETRTIVIVSTRRLNKILWIDRENLRANVQAGITGLELEQQLKAEGFTSGHEPDSMELSTLGGWIATNASGMKKNKYGNIEQIVETVKMVTPRGTFEMLQAQPRISIGMQLQSLLFGSEGNLGLITESVIRIHKLPEVQKYGSVVFPNFRTGTDFMYALMQKGVLPASLRLLDNVQFRFGSALKPKPTAQEKLMTKIQKKFLVDVKGFKPYDLCAATIVMEGTREEVAYQSDVVFKLAKEFGGVSGGSGNGQRGYNLTYAIAYLRDFFAEYDTIGETYETTVPWSNIHTVINAVLERADELHAEYKLPGRPYVSPRISQVYHSGVCIYFTHGFSTQGIENPDRIFSAVDHELRQTIMDAGGSLSHHHGIGKLRSDFMETTLSNSTIEVLRDIKKVNDPNNIFGIRNNIFFEPEGESEQEMVSAD